MNELKPTNTIVVRTERKKHIIAVICLLLLFCFFLAAYIMGNKEQETEAGIAPFVIAIGTLLVAIGILADMFWFRMTVEGTTVHVTRYNLKETFDFNISEIRKIDFRSQHYKSFVTYYTSIATADKKVEISNSLVGYKSMLIYLKEQYDNGLIPRSAILEFDYKELVENIEYYAKF